MNKVFGLVLAGGLLTSVSVGYASVSKDCGYDDKGYFHSGGQVYAHGTMQDARACAAKGLLPDVVRDRLGWLGSSDEAADIKLLNASVISAKAAEAKAKAEAEAKAKAEAEAKAKAEAEVK
jgi:hypothetical protein